MTDVSDRQNGWLGLPPDLSKLDEKVVRTAAVRTASYSIRTGSDLRDLLETLGIWEVLHDARTADTND